MAATIKIPTTFVAEDKFTSVVKKMTSGVSKFSKSSIAAVERLDQKMNRTFKRMNNWGQMAVGLGAGLIAKSAFDDIRNFEESLVGVGKTTGMEGQKLLNLGDNFIDTSDKLNSISTEKLLELGQVAGQMGIKGSENILKFATTLAKLEKASDVKGEEGASKIARILTLTGEGVSSVDRFSSALVSLGNNSAATEGEILGVTSEIARATATYKLTSSTLLGISAAMKSLDVRPEAAGTAIGKVFREIEMATISGGAKMTAFAKVLNVSDKEVLRLFENDKETLFKKFIGGLTRIGSTGGSVQKTLTDLGLSGETISKGIGPLATNFDLLSDKLNLAKTGFKENKALNEEFAASQKTINAALKSITIGFSNFITQATNSQGPLGATRDVLFFIGENMDVIIPILLSLVGLFIAMKTIVWGARAATAAYNLVLGIQTALTQQNKRALIGNTVAQGAYKVAMGIGTAVTWLATAATTAFGIAMNLGLWPILAIIAAIAGVILVIRNWSSITDWFGKKWEKFTSWISELWGKVTAFFTEFDFKQMFIDIGQSIVKFLLFPLQGLLSLLSNLPGKVGELASLGLENLGKFTGEIDVNKPKIDSPEERNSQMIHEVNNRGRLDVNFNDPGGMVRDVERSGAAPIPILTSTQGQR